LEIEIFQQRHILTKRLVGRTKGLNDYMRAWLEDKVIKHLKVFLCILVNSIWWARNSIIFKDLDIPPEIYANQITDMMKELKVIEKGKKTRIPIMPILDSNISWGFFDGAN